MDAITQSRLRRLQRSVADYSKGLADAVAGSLVVIPPEVRRTKHRGDPRAMLMFSPGLRTGPLAPLSRQACDLVQTYLEAVADAEELIESGSAGHCADARKDVSERLSDEAHELLDILDVLVKPSRSDAPRAVL
jgi:hypothetical protein